MRSPLYVTVEAVAGTPTSEVCTELVNLARHLKCGVQCEMNGVTVMAHGDARSSALYEAFEEALLSKRPHKYASV